MPYNLPLFKIISDKLFFMDTPQEQSILDYRPLSCQHWLFVYKELLQIQDSEIQDKLEDQLYPAVGDGCPTSVKMLLLEKKNFNFDPLLQVVAEQLAPEKDYKGNLFLDNPLSWELQRTRINKREQYLEILSLLVAQPRCNLFFGDPAIQDPGKRKESVVQKRAGIFSYGSSDCEFYGREEVKIAAISDHFHHHFPAAQVMVLCLYHCPDQLKDIASKIFALVCNEFKPNPKLLDPVSQSNGLEFNLIKDGVLNQFKMRVF